MDEPTTLPPQSSEPSSLFNQKFPKNIDQGFLVSVLDQHAIVSETDINGVITYVNDKFVETSGYASQELVGKTHSILNSGFRSEAFFKDLWATISTGQSWEGEIRNRRKNGEYYWLKSTIAPVPDKRGLPRGYLSIQTDITAIKNAEGSRQLKETFDFLPDEVYFFNPDNFALTYLNREARRQVGWSEAEIEGRFVWDLNTHFAVEHQNFSAENLKSLVDRLLVSKDNKVSYDFNGRDGQVFESTLQIVRLNQRESVVVVIFRDVSGREAAKKVARQYSTTLSLIQNQVYEFSPESLRFSYVNRAAEFHIGWTSAELMTMSPIDLKPEFTEPKFRALIAPLVAGELETLVFQTLHKKKTGELLPVEVSLKHMAVRGEDERIVAVVQDISARVKADKEIQNFKSSFDLGQNEVYMFWCDNLEYIYLNRAAMASAGFLDAVYRGKSPRDHLSQKQIERFLKRAEPLIAGETDIIVFEVYDSSQNRPLEVTLQLIKPEGDRARFFAIHRDITDRKVAESEIAQFKSTLDLMRVEIYMYRPDTLQFIYLNSMRRLCPIDLAATVNF